MIRKLKALIRSLLGIYSPTYPQGMDYPALRGLEDGLSGKGTIEPADAAWSLERLLYARRAGRFFQEEEADD